jgi:hypothetical protein
MALKFKHNSRDEIPEAQSSLYVEREGAWVLDVEGAADKAKLDEFRGNNIALSNELSELKQRFDGIDPAEVRKLADEKRKLEEAAQLKAGEFDKVLEVRVETVKSDHANHLSCHTRSPLVNTITFRQNGANPANHRAATSQEGTKATAIRATANTTSLRSHPVPKVAVSPGGSPVHSGPGRIRGRGDYGACGTSACVPRSPNS